VSRETTVPCGIREKCAALAIRLLNLTSKIIIIIIINLLAQKHDRVTCATKQIERDSKDSDATNSYPEKVQIKLVCNTLQK